MPPGGHSLLTGDRPIPQSRNPNCLAIVLKPNLTTSFAWVSYDKVGVLYSGKLGNRSEARASDLRSHRGLWWNRIKLRLYEGKQSEYSPRTCSIDRPAGGSLCPHLLPYEWRRLKLDLLLWQRSSNLSDIFFFVSILLLLSIELKTLVPSRVASQWRERRSSYNGDHNSSEMAGAPPVGRRARTTRTTTSKYVRTTLLFGAHPSSRLFVASVPRQLCHIDHSAAELPNPHPSDLFAPRSASMLHSTSPRAASTSPKIGR